jgi:L-cystine uptake protein TcyP (sodium:dicarboxylate symporter family)
MLKEIFKILILIIVVAIFSSLLQLLLNKLIYTYRLQENWWYILNTGDFLHFFKANFIVFSIICTCIFSIIFALKSKIYVNIKKELIISIIISVAFCVTLIGITKGIKNALNFYKYYGTLIYLISGILIPYIYKGINLISNKLFSK